MPSEGIEGVTRILIPTTDFKATSSFFSAVMGFAVDINSVPDNRFHRQAIVKMPNGVSLEVVEPTPDHRSRYAKPIVCLQTSDASTIKKHLIKCGIDTIKDPIITPDGSCYRIDKTTDSEPLISEDGKTEGIEWILIPTPQFDAGLTFLHRDLKLPIETQGTAVNDPNFDRYAMFKLRNRMVLELVEPKPSSSLLFNGPVVSITVGDLKSSYSRLKRAGIDKLSDIIDDETGIGWFYFHVPGAGLFQLQGPFSSN